MKNVKVFGAILMMAILMFTSCLGDGSNSYTRTSVGVIGYSKNYQKVLQLSEYESIYSAYFSDYQEGDCCYAHYELDLDLPENNSEIVNANGYYTVKVSQKGKFDQYAMSYNMTDTTKLLPNETPITHPVYDNGAQYVKGRLFVTHQFVQLEKQQTNWEISYNPDFNDIPKNNNTGNNIYDVFLRATITTAGSGTKGDGFPTNAYNMTNYFNTVANREKSAGNKTFDIRFNYVSEIDTAKNLMTWKQSNALSMYVEAILPEK